MEFKCICGSNKYTTKNRQGFITDETGANVKNDIPIAVCHNCELIRQIDLPFLTEKEYQEYYAKKYPPINKKYQIKNYQFDLDIAKKKFNKFNLAKTKKLLDLGCGSGALVEFSRKEGINAYGCELLKYHYAPNNPYIYYRKFEDIHFPTDYFDSVVCCDVIEHVLNPESFLKELFRVTNIEGNCYIEIPLFFEKGGDIHWKRIEHIWYFTLEQFEKLLKKIGFNIEESIKINHTKIVFVVNKPEQKRIKLLLPPGIGDTYWSLVKTEALLKRENITPPVDAYVATPKAKKDNSHERSFSFLQMFPFLNSTGKIQFASKNPIWKEGYLKQGRTIFKDVLECDYFITWNGHLRSGKPLEEIDSDLKCNWDLSRFISLREENYRKKSITQYGNYLVLYWVFQGTNKLILKHFSIEQIAKMINKIIAKTRLIPILVGAKWDMHEANLERLKELLPENLVDLRSKTTIEEVFGLIRGSKAVIGIPSGITIMSGVFGVKTILLWSEYFTKNGVHRDFAWNTFPPAVRKKTYFAEYAEDITEDDFMNRVVSVINEEKIKEVLVKSKQKKIRVDKSFDVNNTKIEESPYFSIRDLEIEDKKEKRLTEKEIAITCVLKSGGPYDIKYVEMLHKGIEKYTTIKYRFIVLSDILKKESGYEVIPLIHKWPGWWSKLELFRPGIFEGLRVIYFDLDTMIIGNIDKLLEYDHKFTMLRPFNMTRYDSFTSGVMAWGQDISCIYNQFKTFYGQKVPNDPAGDRKYILGHCNCRPEYINSIQRGIYSYKWHCKSKVPKDATIVCFHGHPRPHEIDWKINLG